MTAAYQWAPGAVVKLNAQIVGEQLESIKNRNNGVLTPATVVDEARAKRSPLHSYFEWDDKSAGEKYRLQQAGYLIRHIVVRIEEPPAPTGKRREDRAPIRAFVKVQTTERRGFVAIQEAMGDDEMRQQVLKQAWSELKGWQARYREYEELSTVFTVIDTVQGELKLAS